MVRPEHLQENIDAGFLSHLSVVLEPSKHNVFTFSVNHVPVPLGDQTFWLPSRITSDLKDKTNPISLHNEGNCTEFHGFGATVTIFPATGD
jgi:hypothetical protein